MSLGVLWHLLVLWRSHFLFLHSCWFLSRFCWNFPLSGQRGRTWPTTVSMGSMCSVDVIYINAAVWLQAELPATQVQLPWIICRFTLMAVLYAPAFCEGNTVARMMQYTEVLVTSWTDRPWTFFESNSLYPLLNGFVAVTPSLRSLPVTKYVWGWAEAVQLH